MQAWSGDKEDDPCHLGSVGGPDMQAWSGDKEDDPCHLGSVGGPDMQAWSGDMHRFAPLLILPDLLFFLFHPLAQLEPG